MEPSGSEKPGIAGFLFGRENDVPRGAFVWGLGLGLGLSPSPYCWSDRLPTQRDSREPDAKQRACAWKAHEVMTAFCAPGFGWCGTRRGQRKNGDGPLPR